MDKCGVCGKEVINDNHVHGVVYRLYDEHEEEYVEDVNTFEGIQEYLANQWIDVPDEEEDGDMYDKIMTAKLWDQLEEFASGLGYTIEEEE